MNNIIKMTVILALVGALSGLLLTGANMLTAPVLEQNTLQQKMELLQDFFPAAEETSSEEIEGGYHLILFIIRKVNFWGVMALAHTAGYGGERSNIIWLSGAMARSRASIYLNTLNHPGSEMLLRIPTF